MMRATAAIGITAALLSGCRMADKTGEFTASTTKSSPSASIASSTSAPAQSTTAFPSGPRSQVVKQLTLPPGSQLAGPANTWFENWMVDRTRDSVESYLAPQLPVFKGFDGRPWCKKVTAKFNLTKQ